MQQQNRSDVRTAVEPAHGLVDSRHPPPPGVSIRKEYRRNQSVASGIYTSAVQNSNVKANVQGAVSVVSKIKMTTSAPQLAPTATRSNLRAFRRHRGMSPTIAVQVKRGKAINTSPLVGQASGASPRTTSTAAARGRLDAAFCHARAYRREIGHHARRLIGVARLGSSFAFIFRA